MKQLTALLFVLALAWSSVAPVGAQSADLRNATARYAPDVEGLLLQNGYYANIIQVGDRRGLRASQRNYSNSVWTRDLDYAISGYSYALADMSVLRENTELFLERVDADGIAPETIYLREGRLDHENRRSWDSMPNLIHAAYVYIAKTGDRAFYQRHRDTLLRIGAWIAGRDTNGDGLPDASGFPYGYYDSVANGVMHTYALAKFYTAYQELAALERFDGHDGTPWEQRAERLRMGFHQPLAQGGYWHNGQPWPLAWKRADGSTVNTLETFGVFAALQSGLIGPDNGQRYTHLNEWLHTLLPDLVGGPSPMRLTAGGYPPDIRREVDPPVPVWMLDNSAPWIVGLAAPAFAAAGYPQDAATTMQAYMEMARTTEPPVLEFVAGDYGCFGAGTSGDGGRTWDSAAWFLAVYGGHYGITMTPQALEVQPRPFQVRLSDGFENLSYQGALVQMALDAEAQTYRLQTDRPINVVLRPMGTASELRVNQGERTTEAQITLEPGREYTVESFGGTPPPTSVAAQPDSGRLYDCGPFREVWGRTDQPVAEGALGRELRSWVWGPQPLTPGFREPYAEGPDGRRLVQYYDKSRMEVNNPDTRDGGTVTNGLLVVEMIEGRVQVGNEQFVDAEPADEVVAGDPAASNPDAPTYRTFRSVAYPTSPQRAPDRRGQVVTTRLAQDGSTRDDPELARYNVTIDTYNEQLGHNIPQEFTAFLNRRGLVYENGRYVNGQIIDPNFVVGLPISEPYWARVRVDGTERDVLMQAFERRVLTYTPDNLPEWRVEMGNVGQHYLNWRYGR
jgi:hypothetical protein